MLRRKLLELHKRSLLVAPPRFIHRRGVERCRKRILGDWRREENERRFRQQIQMARPLRREKPIRRRGSDERLQERPACSVVATAISVRHFHAQVHSLPRGAFELVHLGDRPRREAYGSPERDHRWMVLVDVRGVRRGR